MSKPEYRDFDWNLRLLMAERGMFATTDLIPLLAERGVQLSVAQVHRLVTQKPERLNMKTLCALTDILQCGVENLIEVRRAPMRAAKPRAAGDAGNDVPRDGLRPKPAQIRSIDK